MASRRHFRKREASHVYTNKNTSKHKYIYIQSNIYSNTRKKNKTKQQNTQTTQTKQITEIKIQRIHTRLITHKQNKTKEFTLSMQAEQTYKAYMHIHAHTAPTLQMHAQPALPPASPLLTVDSVRSYSPPLSSTRVCSSLISSPSSCLLHQHLPLHLSLSCLRPDSLILSQLPPCWSSTYLQRLRGSVHVHHTALLPPRSRSQLNRSATHTATATATTATTATTAAVSAQQQQQQRQPGRSAAQLLLPPFSSPFYCPAVLFYA